MNLGSRIENRIVDDMTPKQVRYLTPVPPQQAHGKLAQIYRQIRNDFQLVPPITLLSSAPDLLAGLWAISRESQIVAGRVSRRHKEVVAAAVSSINRCPYCVDAHAGLLHATAGHNAANAIVDSDTSRIAPPTGHLIQWALATRSPASPLLTAPPFSAVDAPELIGTALTYHFLNRMVSLFLSASPLPMASGSRFRKTAIRLFGATVGKRIVSKLPDAGDSLAFLPTAALPDDFAWARPNPYITAAFAGFSVLMEQAGRDAVPEDVRVLLMRRLAQWQGEHMGLSREWLQQALDSLSAPRQDIARLVFLAALAPHRVDEQIVHAFRRQCPSDQELLAASGWACYAATRRISLWLQPAQPTTGE